MSDELLQGLEEFVRQRKGDGVIVAKVTAVDIDNMLFTAVDGDGNEYVEVRINATPGPVGFLVIPAVNATVLMIDIGDSSQDYFMLHASDLQEIRMHVGTLTEVFMNSQEIRLGTQNLEKAVVGETLNTNLETLINQLIAVIDQLQLFAGIQSGVATGPLAPLNAGYQALNSALSPIKTEFTILRNTSIPQHLSSKVKVSK